MYFYEFFYKQENGKLVDIPVIVQNYEDASQNRINTNLENKQNLKLNRRLFLFDNISGYEGNIDPLNRPENSLGFFQYADRILLEFQINSLNNELLKPFIYIRYNTIKLENESKEEFKQFNLKIIYENESSIFNSILISLFIIVNIITLLVSFIRIKSWLKYNLSTEFSDTEGIIKLMYYISILFSTWSFGMFFFFIIYIGIIFLIFKFQTIPYLFLPNYESHKSQYYPFNVMFWLIFSSMLLSLIKFLIKLNKRKIIVLDFEKQGLDNKNNSLSVWRSILTVNEFKELSIYRQIKIEYLFITFLIFIEGFGFKNLTKENTFPSLERSNLVSNYVLEYSLHSLLILFLALIYSFFRKLLKFKISYKIDDFLDLCSISNISLFIFSTNSYGFYIHGNNPLGRSEGTIEDFRLNLKKESKGFGRNRGLLINDKSNLQTFEVLIPYKIKKVYEILFVKPTDEEIKDKMNKDTISYNTPSIPNNIDIGKIEKNISNFNLFLKNNIENISSKGNENILKRSFTEKLFDFPPNADLKKEYPYFIKDEKQRITECMVVGNEYFYIIILINFYFGMQYAIRNPAISIFITYIFHLIVEVMINRITTKNISRNTWIKEEFLN